MESISIEDKIKQTKKNNDNKKGEKIRSVSNPNEMNFKLCK